MEIKKIAYIFMLFTISASAYSFDSDSDSGEEKVREGDEFESDFEEENFEEKEEDVEVNISDLDSNIDADLLSLLNLSKDKIRRLKKLPRNEREIQLIKLLRQELVAEKVQNPERNASLVNQLLAQLNFLMARAQALRRTSSKSSSSF